MCHEYKANEKFTGKGHAQHICKRCMSALKHGTVREEANPGRISDDFLAGTCERKSFKKLDRDEKLAIKEFMTGLVTEYCEKERQIPLGGSLSEIKKTLMRVYEENYCVILKDDTELKNYLRDHALATINRFLKAESQEK